MDADVQNQIDEDHRLALELSQFPSSHRDIESNGYMQVSPKQHSPVITNADYADFGGADAGDYVGVNGNRTASYTTGSASSSPNNRTDDWTLARALQALEFEIAAEVDQENYETLEEHDFRVKEIRASGCRAQLCTFSAFCVLVYIAVFIASTQIEGESGSYALITSLLIWALPAGLAPSYENPMIGPPVVILVRFGAKEASLQ
jgi:hypothetical protein